MLFFKRLTVFSAAALLAACQQVNLPQGDYQQLSAEETEMPLQLLLQEGKISGFTGCNNVMGQYSLDKGELVVSQLASTMMACAPEDMQREQQFNQFLQNRPKVSIEDNVLILSENETIYQFSLR